MHIESQFSVAAPVDQAWSYLLDVQRVARCVPGAKLTQVVNDRTYKGRVTIKAGAVTLVFGGTIEVIERDEASHRVVMKANGSEEKGKGQAQANVIATLHSAGNSTSVKVVQDIDVSGAVAQYGRGMMQDVTAALTRQFEDCLRAQMPSQLAASGSSAEGTGKSGGLRKLFGGRS